VRLLCLLPYDVGARGSLVVKALWKVAGSRPDEVVVSSYRKWMRKTSKSYCTNSSVAHTHTHSFSFLLFSSHVSACVYHHQIVSSTYEYLLTDYVKYIALRNLTPFVCGSDIILHMHQTYSYDNANSIKKDRLNRPTAGGNPLNVILDALEYV
jgi:hypothetical protein